MNATTEQLKELSDNLQNAVKAQDGAAQNKIFNEAVKQFDALIKSALKGCYHGPEIEYDDIYNNALMIFYKSLLKYRYSAEYEASTYFINQIKYGTINYIFRQDGNIKIPNKLKEDYNRLRKVPEAELTAEQRAFIQEMNRLKTLSLNYDDNKDANSDDVSLADTIESAQNIEADFERAEEIAERINSLKGSLTTDEYYLLYAHFAEGLSFQEIADKTGKTRQAISQKCDRLVKRVRRVAEDKE